MKRSPSAAHRWVSIAFVLITALLFAGAGCGGAPAANMGADAKVAGMPESPPAPQNLGEAEAQFAQAERGVFGAFGRDKLEAQARKSPGQFAEPPAGQMAQQPVLPSATATEASPPPPPKDGDRAMQEGEAKAATAAGATADLGGYSSSPCETACRALASMHRAASHICTLAGDDSDHCANARERVRAATERVRQSCSECSE